MERPWIKFYTRDWLDDLALRKCSAEARAVLMDLMCLANEGAPYGHLSDTHGPLTAQFIAGRCALPLPRFKKAVAELLQYERLSKNAAGVLFIKRMVRDEEIRVKRAAGGIKSVDHPNTQKGGVEGYPSGTKEGGGRSDSDSDSASVAGVDTPNPEKTSTRETLSDLRPKPPQVPDAGPVFERFIGAFIAAGAALGEQDLMDAARGNKDHVGFLQYSPEDQEQIAQSAQDQAITTEARFMGLPINFIGKGRWRRRAAVRVLPDPKTAKEQQDKSESVERLRENLVRRQQRENERAEWKATTA